METESCQKVCSKYDNVTLNFHLLTRDFAMSMQRKTITITDQMESWVKAQVNSGKYGNDSEYFRDLIRRDQDRREAETQLRSMLDEAKASSKSDRIHQEIWAATETGFA